MNTHSYPIRVALLVSVTMVAGSACAHSGKTQQKPGSSDTVTAEEIERSPNESIEQYLMGRFPGVWVETGSDGSIAVRIRGTTTVHGDAEPLYVVDGIALQPGPNGTLFGIKPHDVASIQVLKDGASTAMYGMRGANGVLLITTRRR